MKLVVIESPYAGDVERNRTYLNRCIRDCIDRGESPYASHKMLVDSLDDASPEERQLGIDAGFNWSEKASLAVFYSDYGISNGMLMAANYYGDIGITIELRQIGENPQ